MLPIAVQPRFTALLKVADTLFHIMLHSTSGCA